MYHNLKHTRKAIPFAHKHTVRWVLVLVAFLVASAAFLHNLKNSQ